MLWEKVREVLSCRLRHLLITFMVTLSLIMPTAWAGDTSIALLSVAGIVPTYFSVYIRGQPGDLDLTPKAVVNDHPIGLVHFKFNEDILSLTVSSSTATGFPEDASSNAYNFGGGAGFKVAFRAGCQTVDATYNTPFTLTAAGTDVKSATAAALTTFGIEEDCIVTATYQGTTVNLPLGGLYQMNVVLTMVAP